ncbi:phage tail tape measure protein [Gemmobacter nectariphilus]|uniref:phage tail tape measure protein n=1 Tax=Gemmobacter nectariphilus TaxID=220343 RepID=UPI0004271834|nr:phage tail tape measure protein [Gemmobacter nectariphilus]
MNATADERLVVMLEARIRDFEKNMQRAEQRGTRSYQNLRRGSQSATRQMEADMVRASGRINQALAATSTRIGAFGKAFAGGLVGGVVAGAFAGLTQNITQTVKGIASIGDEAKRAGMGLQAFQEWSAVADRTRVGMDALVDGFKELNLRADEWIVTGGGAAAEAFTRLGYNATDLKAKLQDPSALMLELIDRLKQLDTAARIRVADELFGGTGGEQFVQLIDRGADGLQKIINEAHATGAVLDEQLIRKAQDIDERFTAMTQKFTAWGKSVAVALADLPFEIVESRLREIFPDEAFGRAVLGDEIFDRLTELRALTDEQAEAAGRLAQMHREMGNEGRSAANAILMAMNELPSQEFAAIRGELAGIAEEMRTAASEFDTGAIKADEFQKRMGEAEAKASTLFDTLKDDSGITLSNAISAVGRLGTAIANALGLARSLKATLPGGVAKDVPGYLDSLDQSPSAFTPNPNAPTTRPRAAPNELGFDVVGTGGGGKSKADEFARMVEQVQEHTRALELEAVALVAAAAGGQAFGDAVEYARLKADLLNAAMKAGKQITPQLEAEIDALARSYVAAGASAEEAARRLRQVEDEGKRGADAIADIFGSVLDGTKSAKEAIADLLMEMAKVQMRNAIIGLAGSGGFLGKVIGSIGASLTPSYDGGGYTGSGSRSGGLDGKGGFMAMLHPKETVIDHTRGQSAPTKAQALSVTVTMDPSTAKLGAFVRDETGRVLAYAGPQLVDQAVQATYARAQEYPIG